MFCYCMMNLLMKQEVCQFNRNLARDFFLNHLLVLVKYLLSLSQELYFCHRNTVPVRGKKMNQLFSFLTFIVILSSCESKFLIVIDFSYCDHELLLVTFIFFLCQVLSSYGIDHFLNFHVTLNIKLKQD